MEEFLNEVPFNGVLFNEFLSSLKEFCPTGSLDAGSLFRRFSVRGLEILLEGAPFKGFHFKQIHARYVSTNGVPLKEFP